MKIKLRLSALVLSALILSSCSVSRIDSGNDATTESTPAQTVGTDGGSTQYAAEYRNVGRNADNCSEETTTDHSGAGVISGGVEFIGTKYTRAELEALDNTKNGFGPGVNVDADNRPSGATVLQDRYGQYGAAFIAPNSDKIYLSFDLGYENGYTTRIIDTLNEKGVKGLFFVTMEYCKASPDVVKRIIDEGHVLGNHSVHHKSMPTLSIDEMQSEIMELHNYIKEKYGYEMSLFRPPMGEFSVRSLALAQSLGYQSVFWSFAYLDYDVNNQPEPTAALARVTGAAHGGGIFLLHAVSKTNTEILGSVIDDFRSKGFTVAKYSAG
ncbi:MAG: polysaccharide deacetylase family protein [Lachnospiraceae bacterium]